MAINQAFVDFVTPVPADWLNNVNTFVNTPVSASTLNYTSSGTGAVLRTISNKFGEIISVKDFGAKGDGITNDTSAITNADIYARSIGARLYFPGQGPYMASQLVIHTGSNWFGDISGTILKQIAGSNTDFLYGLNSTANWGQPDPASFVNGYSLCDLIIDGNWNSGSGNTSGGGIAIFGAPAYMHNIYVRNVAGHGIRTEYPPSGRAWLTQSVEGEFVNIKVDLCGQRGWWFNGPNDSVIKSAVVVDAGQAGTNSWDAFYFDSNGIGRCYGLHAWNRAGAVTRHQFGINIRPGASSEFVDCQFEGAYAACVGLFSTNCKFDSTCNYFSAWNGVTFYMGLNAGFNVIKGTFGSPGSGRPATTGLVMGSLAGDSIASNTIDALMVSQEAANIKFTTFDGGANVIRLHCWNNTAATYTGTPNTNDDIEILFQNVGTGVSHLKNRIQRGSVSIAANSSVTWSYPFAFTVAPIITFCAEGPSGNLTTPMWITSRTTTGVTIFNNNAQSATLDLIAVAND